MNSPKEDALLNLATGLSREEQNSAGPLMTGYNREKRSWEVIVKYHGDLSGARALGAVVEPLINGYAILTIPEQEVERVAALPEIEYMEKPFGLYTQLLEPLVASCALQTIYGEPYLTGKGVLIAILDSGIDYRSSLFRDEEGKSRIVALWDQSLEPDEEKGFRAPEGFAVGVYFTKEQIDKALEQKNEADELIPSFDYSEHGTAVAAIAAGYSEEKAFQGMAGRASLLVVKLGNSGPGEFPRTTQLMRAVKFCLDEAARRNMPLCINISFGNTYGAHDGSTIMEQFLDAAAGIGKTAICVGSGNEGNSYGHASGMVRQGMKERQTLSMGDYERNMSLQIWTAGIDEMLIVLTAPGGEWYALRTEGDANRMEKATLAGAQVFFYYSAPSPFSSQKELFIQMQSQEGYLRPGDWEIAITGLKIRLGEYHMYLPSQEIRGAQTFFLTPDTARTCTIPGTAKKVITVGAYDTLSDSFAAFSGRGNYPVEQGTGKSFYGEGKPDLVAPGVRIRSLGTEESTRIVTGTSFATPFVTGACALLMEQGIIRGKAPYCYGEKIKNYLKAGARKLRAEALYPNVRTGWGKLCVYDSLPK